MLEVGFILLNVHGQSLNVDCIRILYQHDWYDLHENSIDNCNYGQIEILNALIRMKEWKSEVDDNHES